jgi:hypothetical protein
LNKIFIDERRVNMDEAKIRHVRRPATPAIAIPVLLLASLLLSAGLLGATDRVRLSLGVGYAQMHTNWPASNWNVGFDFGVLIKTWKTAGFQISGLYHGASTYISSVLLADLGVWKSFGQERTPTLILLGASFLGATWGDDDNLGFGVHAGVHQELWFDRHIGLYGRGVLRFMLSGDSRFYPSLSAGLTIRF